jgi:hypothetical protein
MWVDTDAVKSTCTDTPRTHAWEHRRMIESVGAIHGMDGALTAPSLLGSAAVAAVLVLVHVGARRLRFPGPTPRSVWLSAAGGVSVAFVFLQLLPELHESQQAVREASTLRVGSGQSEIYLVALAGLTIFYGLERLASASRARSMAAGEGNLTATSVFAVHVGSFAVYNAVIGYLLVHGERSNELLYATAMALHFIANDQSLREHHQERYDRVGRWVLAAAIICGWAVAVRWELPELAVRLMIALLAGGVILNVMKEELPENRKSRFWAFLLGVGVYGAVLLTL